MSLRYASVGFRFPFRTVKVSTSQGAARPHARLAYGDHLHIDGGTLDNLPVSAAREFGAGVVIACEMDLDKGYRLGYQCSYSRVNRSKNW